MSAVNSIGLRIQSTDVAGDTAVAIVIADQTITPPAGWTLIKSGTIASVNYWIGYLTETAGSPGSLNVWTFGAVTANCAACMFAFSGVTGIDGTPSVTGQSGSSLSAASITTTAAAEVVLILFLVLSQVIIGGLSAGTGLVDLGGAWIIGGISLSTAVRTRAAAGATGAITALLNKAAPGGAGIQLALKGTSIVLLNSVAVSNS